MVKPNDNPKNGSKLIGALVAALGAFVGGSGVLYIYVGTPIGQQVVRPDPFTGQQAAALTREIQLLRNDLRRHTDNHPDISNRFDARISVNSDSIKSLERRLDRHEDDD